MALTSPFAIELTEAERAALERLADSRAAPFGQVQRAGVILAVADGMSNAAAARAAGRHVDAVRAWRKRFAAERLVALTGRPRPLGRPRLAPGHKLRIIAAATQAPPGVDTAWTHRLLADHLRISGLAVSASQVGRILNSVDLKPHLADPPGRPGISSPRPPRCARCTVGARRTRWCSAWMRKPGSPHAPASTPISPDAPGSAPAGSSSTSATAPSPSLPR
jgi:transposase